MPVQPPEELHNLHPTEVEEEVTDRLPLDIHLDDELTVPLEGRPALDAHGKEIMVFDLPEEAVPIDVNEATSAEEDPELKILESSKVLNGVPTLEDALDDLSVSLVSAGEGLRTKGEGVIEVGDTSQTIIPDRDDYNRDRHDHNRGRLVLRVVTIPDPVAPPFESPYPDTPLENKVRSFNSFLKINSD